MRICSITPYSPKRITGVGTFLSGHAGILTDLGHESIILAPEMPSSQAELDFHQSLVELPVSGPRYYRGWMLTRSVRKWIRKNHRTIDILHLHTPTWLCLAAAREGKKLGLPIILTVHGKYPELKTASKEKRFKQAQRKVLDLSNAVTYVDEDSKRAYKYPGSVISNGVDTRLMRRNQLTRVTDREHIGILQKETAFLFLGRWAAHKGIFEAITAFFSLHKQKKEVKLVLVGTGDRQRVWDMVQKLQLESRVKILGKVDDIKPIMNACDVYLLPTSKLEGLPFSLIEAMSYSMTVIAGSASGISDVITNGSDGILIPPRSIEQELQKKVVDDVLDKMLWCLDNLDESTKLGIAARKTVKNKFSLLGMSQKYIENYKKLMS